MQTLLDGILRKECPDMKSRTAPSVPNCPACGSENIEPLRAYRASPGTVFCSMHLLECNHCALCFAWPLPGPLALEEYYVNHYWHDRDLNSWARRARERWHQHNHARAQLAFITDSRSEQRFDGVLDIGAGFGEFLDEVRDIGGQNLCAVELSDDSAKKIRSHGLTVIPKLWEDPETVALVLGALPIVRLARASHVLEHTAAPREFLRRIANVLADDGVLMCEVPNDPKETLLLSSRIRPQDTPHLLFFSEDSLRKLLETSGFSVIATGVYGDALDSSIYKKSALRSRIRQLLPTPMAHLIAAIKAIAFRLRHAPCNRASISWRRNAHGSWLRVLAVKHQPHS
jgi:SAM-dependent methyltransferase